MDKSLPAVGRHETKKQVFHRKRLVKVEKSSFYLTFFYFGKKVREEITHSTSLPSLK
jgi:hypothetical protein